MTSLVDVGQAPAPGCLDVKATQVKLVYIYKKKILELCDREPYEISKLNFTFSRWSSRNTSP